MLAEAQSALAAPSSSSFSSSSFDHQQRHRSTPLLTPAFASSLRQSHSSVQRSAFSTSHSIARPPQSRDELLIEEDDPAGTRRPLPSPSSVLTRTSRSTVSQIPLPSSPSRRSHLPSAFTSSIPSSRRSRQRPRGEGGGRGESRGEERGERVLGESLDRTARS
jgi:hypothetical protein